MRAIILTIAVALSSCKPPPSDAAMERDMPGAAPTFASEPLSSPDVEGAIWVPSQSEGRIIYGIPDQPALIALECFGTVNDPQLQITRMAPADEGAKALLALVGNGALGRVRVSATEVGSRFEWRGTIAPTDRNIEPLLGPRKVTATIPGAGMVEMNPSPVPGAFIESCKGGKPFAPEADDETIELDETENSEEDSILPAS